MPGTSFIFRKEDGTNLLQYEFGEIGGTLQTLTGTTALSASTWYFVAVVRDVGGDTVRLYRATADGDVTQDASATDTTTASHGTSLFPLRFGQQEGGHRMNGRLAEVTLWNRALSVNELRAVKQGRYYELTGKEGHWPLWGVADPEPDLSRNKANATVTGAVLAPHAPVGPYAPFEIDQFYSVVGAAGTAHTATITDSLSITDGEIATYADPRFTYADSLLDYLGRVAQEVFVTLGHPHTDTLGLTDSISVVHTPEGGHQRTVTDALGLTDSATATLALRQTLADALGLTDTATTQQASRRSQADVLGLVDAVSTQQTHKRSLTDALGLTDSITVSASGIIQYQYSFSYSLGLTDQVTRAATIHLTVTDALGLTDAVLAGQVRHLTLTDLLGLTDVASASIGAPVPLHLDGVHTPTLVLTGRHTPTSDLEGKHTTTADLVGSSGLS